jgi:hypothetical protein
MLAGEPLKIVGADHRNGHNLIVEYSDGTTAVYLVEQLRDLNHNRWLPQTANCRDQSSQLCLTLDIASI